MSADRRSPTQRAVYLAAMVLGGMFLVLGVVGLGMERNAGFWLFLLCGTAIQGIGIWVGGPAWLRPQG